MSFDCPNPDNGPLAPMQKPFDFMSEITASDCLFVVVTRVDGETFTLSAMRSVKDDPLTVYLHRSAVEKLAAILNQLLFTV